MSELDLAPRKKMLTILSDDLVYEGWDLPNKFWMVLGTYDDPYLEFVGNVAMDIEHWFMHRAEEGTVKEHIIGLVACWEAWVYDRDLAAHMEDHATTKPEGAQAVRAYQAIIGPELHPARKSYRTVVSAWRDGQAVRVEHYEDRDGKVVLAFEDPPLNGPTGERLVDYMRSMLGINEHHANPLHGLSDALNSEHFKAVLAQAQSENWSNEKIIAEVYKHAPEHLRQQMKPTMPDAVRRLVDGEGETSNSE